MLAKRFRFHGHTAVRRIYKQGRVVRGELGSLHFFIDPKQQRSHAAVVVSRKVSKSAVVRNRIRRRTYEQLRLRMNSFINPAELIVTVYQVEAADMIPEKLSSEVNELLNRARLLKK
jgi:ribonuclease P protein component